MQMPKFYIGPMSKNIVDATIEFINETGNIIGFIPSRRQIEYNGGYVNNWTTEQFYNYLNPKSVIFNTNILLERDHAGPNQGLIEDLGYNSLEEDCKYMDIIHIDPWKKFFDFNEGINETKEMINFCLEKNPQLMIEIGTEEAIRKFSTSELYSFIYYLKGNLEEWKFQRIKYLVIQCGTSLQSTTQTGKYDSERLKAMIGTAKLFNLFTKEHNGDYQEYSIIKEKFELGLDAINIAPEFGVIETSTYIDTITKNWDFGTMDYFYQICFDSKKWKKWVNKDFVPNNNKEELIKICGHYMFSTPEFEYIKEKYQIDDIIKQNIKNKLYELYQYNG